MFSSPTVVGNLLFVGSCFNFLHYDPSRVTKIYALEPNPGMIRLAERQQRRTHLDIEFLHLPGERIPLKDESVDFRTDR